jgi:hypothetical protein
MNFKRALQLLTERHQAETTEPELPELPEPQARVLPTLAQRERSRGASWRPHPRGVQAPVTYRSTHLPGRSFSTRAELLAALADVAGS